jgi:tRNA pseudouridine32 synthase/23S rRNA pseudouridine746 synthase
MSGGTRFGDHCAIDRLVSKILGRQTYFVHRLDHFVWGLIVLTHNKRTAANIAEQFKASSIDKLYQAIIHGS